MCCCQCWRLVDVVVIHKRLIKSSTVRVIRSLLSVENPAQQKFSPKAKVYGFLFWSVELHEIFGLLLLPPSGKQGAAMFNLTSAVQFLPYSRACLFWKQNSQWGNSNTWPSMYVWTLPSCLEENDCQLMLLLLFPSCEGVSNLSPWSNLIIYFPTSKTSIQSEAPIPVRTDV